MTNVLVQACPGQYLGILKFCVCVSQSYNKLRKQYVHFLAQELNSLCYVTLSKLFNLRLYFLFCKMGVNNVTHITVVTLNKSI